mmetsp:Transcript_28974/g.35246  ORF Transcript_28974/g.35246 Transcript_28974/m.35246 type:complete len:103 (-) Transcript_28974:335-643(-)
MTVTYKRHVRWSLPRTRTLPPPCSCYLVRMENDHIPNPLQTTSLTLPYFARVSASSTSSYGVGRQMTSKHRQQLWGTTVVGFDAPVIIRVFEEDAFKKILCR